MHKSATRREETFLRAATGLVQMALTCQRVFSIFKYMSGGGADNSLIGTNGSCNAASTITILHELGAEDRIVFDFGAGDAKFLICAAVSGAKRAIGVEFPENVGHQLLFDAVVQRISQLYGILLPVTWIGMDIDEVVLFFPSLPYLFGDADAVTSPIRRWMKFQEIPTASTHFGLGFLRRHRSRSFLFAPSVPQLNALQCITKQPNGTYQKTVHAHERPNMTHTL
jgi:hypothetical protein